MYYDFRDPLNRKKLKESQHTVTVLLVTFSLP